MGAKPIGNTPEEFAQFIAERAKWAQVIKDANISDRGMRRAAGVARSRDAGGSCRGRGWRWAGRNRKSCAPPLVRGARPAGVRAPLAHPADGLRARGLRRQAGDRDRQHLVRHQPVPRALQGAGGGRQARRVPGRRLPLELPAISLSEPSSSPPPCSTATSSPWRPRSPALAPGGRRGADGRLRQDHARAAHGGDLDEPAGDLRAGGRHAARQLARAGAGLGLGQLEVLGRAAGRHHHHAGLERHRAASPARPACA